MLKKEYVFYHTFSLAEFISNEYFSLGQLDLDGSGWLTNKVKEIHAKKCDKVRENFV